MSRNTILHSLLLASLILLPFGGAAVAATSDVSIGDIKGSQSAMDEGIRSLQTEWARIKYQIPGKDEQMAVFEDLEAEGDQLMAAFPDQAAPKIWQGIILSTHAGVSGGLSALGLVKRAKSLFEEAIQMDENAMDGSAHTSLGSLYYQVPGWPLGFGNEKKAEAHLKQALSINPHGIDPNYFYGDFLYETGRYDEAAVYLQTALEAPDRSDRPLADAGRRQEIRAALAKVQAKLKQ